MNKNVDASYTQDYDQFLEKLRECHHARGTSFGKVPSFGGQPLDLFALYNTVTSFGGISVVTDKRKWDQVFTALGFPPCMNAAYALRQHYCRYLEAYEKIYFFGEEADETSAPTEIPRSYGQMLKYRRVNKPPKFSSLGEPLVQNFNRIMYSLQSGLSNEVDFALNICSLLSNVSNSIFNLVKCPQILSLMLGHVGIWCEDNTFTNELSLEWFSSERGKSFEKFWMQSLAEATAKVLYKENSKDISHLLQISNMDEKTTKLFAEQNDNSKFESNKSPEFCRVNQTCIIIYNFSFEQINSTFLASHDGAKRFLLLSSCSKYNSIQRTGLDAFDNIAEHLNLIGKEDRFTQHLLKVLHTFFTSSNKFQRVRAMSILAKLASRDENKSVLVNLLSQESFKSVVETLYLPDICLLLCALDALYFLSALCTETADCIINVHGCIDILISLCTVRAESFGNQAIQGFRIVENKLSMFTSKNQIWLKSQEQKRLVNPMDQQKPNYMDRQQGYYPRPPMPMRSGIPPMPRPPMQGGPGMLHQIGPYGVPYIPRPPHGMPSQPPYPRMPGQPGMMPLHPTQNGFPPRPQHGMLPGIQPGMQSGMQPGMQLGMQPAPGHRYPGSLGPPLHPNQQASDFYLNRHQSPMNPPIPTDQSIDTLANQKSQGLTLSNPSARGDLVELDSDIFTAHWMSGFYEPHPVNRLKASFIYNDYATVCKELKREGILPIERFVAMLRNILPPHLVQFVGSDANMSLHGIQRRAVPVQVHSKIPKALYLELIKSRQQNSNISLLNNANVPVPSNTNMSLANNINAPVPNNVNVPVPNNVNVPVPNNVNVPVANNVNVPIPNNVNVPVPNNSNIPVPNNTNVPVPSNTNMPVPNNANVPVPSNINVPVPSNTNVPVPNNTNVIVPNNDNVSVTSNTNVSEPNNVNVSVPSNANVLMSNGTNVPVPNNVNVSSMQNGIPDISVSISNMSNIVSVANITSKTSEKIDKQAPGNKPYISPTSTVISSLSSVVPIEATNINKTLSLTPTDTYVSVIGDNKLSNSAECRAMVEKLKGEIEGHFRQFHSQRQNTQIIQMQIQQQLAQHQVNQQQQLHPDVVKGIQQRVQVHYQQMQFHYQKLQQLNTLSEEVQSKLQQFESANDKCDNAFTKPSISSSQLVNKQNLTTASSPIPRLNSSVQSPLTPMNNVGLQYPASSQVPYQPGQSFTVPPATQHMHDYMVPIQHGIAANSVPPSSPRRGKGSRGGGRGKRGKGDPSSPSERGSRGKRGGKGTRGKHASKSGGMLPFQTQLPGSQMVQVGYPGYPGMNPMGSPTGMFAQRPPSSMMQQPAVNSMGMIQRNPQLNPMMGSNPAERLPSPLCSPKHQSPMNQSPMNLPRGSMNQSPMNSPRGSMNQSPMNSPRGSMNQFPTNTHQVPIQKLGNEANQTITLKNPFGQLPLSEALRAVYKNTFLKSDNADINVKENIITNLPCNVYPTTEKQVPAITQYKEPSVTTNLLSTLPSTRPNINGLTTNTPSCQPSQNISMEQVTTTSNSKLFDSKDLLSKHSVVTCTIDTQLETPKVNGGNSNHPSNIEMMTNVNGISNKGIENNIEHLNGSASKEEKELLTSPSSIHNGRPTANHHVDYSDMNGGGTHINDKFNTSVDTCDMKRKINGSISLDSAEMLHNKKLRLEEIQTSELKSIVHLEGLVDSIKPKEITVARVEINQHDKIKQPTVVNPDTTKTNDNQTDLQKPHVSKEIQENDAVIQDEKPLQQVESDEKNPTGCDNKKSNDIEMVKGDERVNGLRLNLEQSNQDFITLSSGSSATNELLRKRIASLSSSTPSSTTSSVESPMSIKQEGDRSFAVLHGKQEINGVFPCQWDHCTKKQFASATELLSHMVEVHAPVEGRMSRCKVRHCSSAQRPRGVLICHFQEKHCSRVNADDVAKNLDFQVEDESPVTRSVRYTATLILRNLIRNSTYGKEILLAYESDLSLLAMSKSEAASAAVDCLYELNIIPSESFEVEEEEEEGQYGNGSTNDDNNMSNDGEPFDDTLNENKEENAEGETTETLEESDS